MNTSKYERTISTILYTDIVGSTELIAERGDKDWAEIIEQHNVASRKEFARFNGQEVHITGDGFLALFATPIQALKCAVAISEAVKAIGIKIRCGLHAGEIEMREDRAVGFGLHLGARVVGQAEAGEILVTSTLKDLVEGSGIEFKGKGEFELKGIPGKRGLFSVVPESVAIEPSEDIEILDERLSSMSGPQAPWQEALRPREIEVLGLISDGLSYREIAQKLHLATGTVKWHKKQIFAKLGVSSRMQAVKKARELQLLDPQPTPAEEGERLLSNLPAQLSSYVGREKEIAEIKELLQSARLVVLTGAGGTGKTRLALQVASELVGKYRDGVWLVELAAVREAGRVPQAIANVLKVTARSDTLLVEGLKRYLKRKHLLLLIDNFEHVLEVAPLMGEILAAAPQVTILATSREQLNVYGEQEYPVHPLEVPEVKGRETEEQILSYDAVELFVQRARAAQPGFNPEEEQLAAIARICVRLDGLPLAIELAAPQVKIYPLSLLAQRLEDSLNALSSGPRDLPERQRTLRATLEWSYELLEEEERTLFARLAVFRGGATLEAIERICGKGLSGSVFDALTSLVDKNLVTPREGRDGELHFGKLETVREYGQEKLIANQEAEQINMLHAAYFSDLAEQASEEFSSAKHTYWFARMQAEKYNLSAALSWSIKNQEHEYGLRAVAAIGDYWYYYGFAAEGRRWAELALENSEHASPALRAGALLAAGNFCLNLNDLQRGKVFLNEALNLYRQLGDERHAAWGLILLGATGLETPAEIQHSFESVQEALAVVRKFGDKGGMTRALNVLGELARLKGDYEAAKSYYEECLALAKETGERLREAIQLTNLGFIAYHKKDYQLAEQIHRDGLLIYSEMDANYGLATHLGSLAGPTAALGRPQRAARFLGASNAELESLGTNQQPADQGEIKLYIDAVQQALGQDAFQEAWEEGQRMTFQEAIAYALSDEDADE
jgi:predicted ATPase/class 3 adenylate cyclase/DNA-binding CsgD family transcriptional regulator